MTAPPEPDCWLHPDVEVGTSPISGPGLFATAPIASGPVVSRLGGRLVSAAALRDLFTAAARVPDDPYIDTITVGADLHLVLPPRRPNGYGNHSCDPNLWWVGPYELAARRDIAAGDEPSTLRVVNVVAQAHRTGPTRIHPDRPQAPGDLR